MNIVITGVDSGLGKELRYLFQTGALNKVIGSSLRDWDDDGRGPVFRMDYGTKHSVRNFADNVNIAFKGEKIDLLINNAGTNCIRTFEELDDMLLTHITRVNFIGPVMLTRYLLPQLHGGQVINITSDAAWRPMRHSLAYNCSKAALDMATKQLARELTKPYDMSIFAIRPGKMGGTAMSAYIDRQVCETRGWTSEQALEYFKANSVTGKEIRPVLVAQLIYNLVLSGLSRNMSGACVDLVG
jgi:NAD(P)-dependent dehydrogenase (short-subunit alcohol dehydrogenase family)